MKHMLKRVISMIIMFALFISITGGQVNATSADIRQSKYNKISKNYDKYDFGFSSKSDNVRKNEYKKLKNKLKTEKKETINGIDIITYDTSVVKGTLNDCKKVNYIQKVNANTYFSYETNDNKTVILAYDECGDVCEKAVYDNGNDSVVLINEDQQTAETIEDFRAAVIEERNIEVEDDGSATLNEENSKTNLVGFNALSNPSNNTVSASATNNNLSQITSSFPTFSKKVLTSASKYCVCLGKNVTVKVKETRNNYVRASYSYKSFIVGSALTGVAIFLGGPMSVAVAVVTFAGVGISIYNTITAAIDVYRSATYKFYYAKEGYVYDTTVYNKDVKVYQNFGTGTFTGGFTSTGAWTWIISDRTNAYYVANSTILSKALSLYNSNIAFFGYCGSYYPD